MKRLIKLLVCTVIASVGLCTIEVYYLPTELIMLGIICTILATITLSKALKGLIKEFELLKTI